jgi:8-oxo-dGTP pyrophosphatase MutT (NUDIX family)
MLMPLTSLPISPSPPGLLVLTAPVTDSITSAFKVLLLKRTSRASFMPNLFVFPGGACDPSDASPAWHEPPLALPRLSVPLLDDHVQAECLADRVCALRETFEETGILLSGASSSRAHESVPFASASSLMLPSAVSLDALPADARARVEVVIAASVAKRAAAAAASSGAAPPAAPADEPASLHARAQRCVHADSASFAPICAAAGLTPPADAVLPFARWVTPHGEAKRFVSDVLTDSS